MALTRSSIGFLNKQQVVKFLGSVIVSIMVGGLGPFLIEATIDPYYQLSRDDFTQTFDGGLAMALCSLGFGLIESPKRVGEHTLADLLPMAGGLLVLSICPLFVLGLLSLISVDLVNWLDEIAGGFMLGTVSVGFVIGIFLAKKV